MRLRKHFSWVVVLGIFLIIVNILLSIKNYNDCISIQEICMDSFDAEDCTCSLATSTGIDYLLSFSLYGLYSFFAYNFFMTIGILLIVFEKKKNNNQKSKPNNQKKDKEIESDIMKLLNSDRK